MEEEYGILENTVRDFSAKFIENNALKIENEGINETLIRSLAEQGFLSMAYQQGVGKAIDMKAFALILENLAKTSPSVAVKVLLTNLFLTLATEESILNDVSSGSKSGTVVLSELLGGYSPKERLAINGNRIQGKKEFVVDSDASFIITLVDSGELVLLKSGFSKDAKHKRLGFRGLDFSTISVNSDNFDVIAKNGLEKLRNAYSRMAIPIAAIAMGIAEGSISKAVEYAKVRMAFNHYLKDFQPIAFNLSSNLAELSMLKQYLSHIVGLEKNSTEALFLKTRSMEAAKEISKNALQTHGGYGYLEDFGVEKFYRDSMALSILFYNEEKEMEQLSEYVFDSKAGFV